MSDASSNGHVSREKFDMICGELTELSSELAAVRRALSAEHRRASALKKQLDDEREEGIDAKTVRTVLEYWRDKTGRDAKTRIDLTTTRAHRVRWALKHWEPRELCLMVVGMMSNDWYVSRGLTDISKHMLKDEETAEKFLRAGRALIPA